MMFPRVASPPPMKVSFARYSFLLPLSINVSKSSSFAFPAYPRFVNRTFNSHAPPPFPPRTMSSSSHQKWRNFLDEEDDSFPLEGSQVDSLSRKSLSFPTLEAKLASLGPDVVLVGEG